MKTSHYLKCTIRLVDDRFCTCHGHAIGAVIEPTDPVMASDIQTLPPQQDDSLNVQMALTTEAGLNDGLVFPFPTFPLPWRLWGQILRFSR